MNKALPRVDLKLAMDNANTDDLDELAEELGREAIAVALALTEPQRPPAPKIDEEERQRMLDALAADLTEVCNRHRIRLGRRVCSAGDARIQRQAFELIRSMAGPEGGADNDPSFSA